MISIVRKFFILFAVASVMIQFFLIVFITPPNFNLEEFREVTIFLLLSISFSVTSLAMKDLEKDKS